MWKLMKEEDVACFKSQEKSKIDYWGCRKKRNGKKGKQTHQELDAIIKQERDGEQNSEGALGMYKIKWTGDMFRRQL